MIISQPILLNKLELSLNFSRSISYIRKSALGINLIKPTKIITILLSKLNIK